MITTLHTLAWRIIPFMKKRISKYVSVSSRIFLHRIFSWIKYFVPKVDYFFDNSIVTMREGGFEPWPSLLETPRSSSWELKGSWLCHRLIMILRNLYSKFYILKSSPTFQVERWHRQVNHKTFYWMRWCITLTYVSNLPGRCYHSTTQHDNLNTS